MRKQYDLRTGPIRRKWWIFLLPLMAAFCIGFVWPFIQGIYLSFCTFTTTSNAKLNGIMNNKAFFSNYIKAFNDPTFVRSFWYSALFAVVSLIIINVLAFTVAYFLTKELKGSNLFRTVFFMQFRKYWYLMTLVKLPRPNLNFMPPTALRPL